MFQEPDGVGLYSKLVLACSANTAMMIGSFIADSFIITQPSNIGVRSELNIEFD